MIEYVLQVNAVNEVEALAQVPILIDQGMPPTHREAIEYLVPNHGPIVEVPPDTVVVVGKLWVASNFGYVPLFPVSEEAIDPTVLSHPESINIRRIHGDLVEKDMAGWEGPAKVFLKRKAGLHRKLLNSEAIEKLLSEAGFVALDPATLSFRDQVRLARGATHIVGPEGSQMLLTVFCRTGTRAVWLNHPFVERIVPAYSGLADLGLQIAFVTGPSERRSEPYWSFSDYTIDESLLAEALEL